MLYLLFNIAGCIVAERVEFGGRFKKIRKKEITWKRKPNKITGSRPYLFVFFPKIPNIAPPKKIKINT